MGFLPKGVWIMDYCGFMGYGIHFSANQHGGPKKVWSIREYGLLELWVKRELTVTTLFSSTPELEVSVVGRSQWILSVHTFEVPFRKF